MSPRQSRKNALAAAERERHATVRLLGAGNKSSQATHTTQSCAYARQPHDSHDTFGSQPTQQSSCAANVGPRLSLSLHSSSAASSTLDYRAPRLSYLAITYITSHMMAARIWRRNQLRLARICACQPTATLAAHTQLHAHTNMHNNNTCTPKACGQSQLYNI